MLRDPDLKRIAAKHGISVVQAILRWHLQYGDVAIPKSLNPERQRQNLDLTAFELDDQDMADIAAMDNPKATPSARTPTGTKKRDSNMQRPIMTSRSFLRTPSEAAGPGDEAGDSRTSWTRWRPTVHGAWAWPPT